MHKPTNMPHCFKKLILLSLIGVLQACGGGGGGQAGIGSGGSGTAVALNGTVVDGLIEGAVVFVDLNGNLQLDAGEPTSSATGANGQFTIDVTSVTQAQWAYATIVTHIPDTAKDADDAGQTLAQAGKRGFTLMSPASAYVDSTAPLATSVTDAFVSPLTTLVANEMAFNNLTLAQARDQVKQRYQLSDDPMADFSTNANASLATAARTVAIALGEAKHSASSDSSSLKEQLAVVAQSVDLKVPDVVTASNTTPSANAIATLKSALTTQVNTLKQQRGQANASLNFQDFVVVFKDNVSDPSAEATSAMAGRSGNVKFSYANAVKGFAVSIPSVAAEAFLEAMSNNPRVDYVEADLVMQTQTTQTGATWGIDRVDQRDLPLSTSYSYTPTGAGVRAYVVDTGILSTHTEFAGRVLAGYSAVSDSNGTADCNGHGTHVAGTIGATTWGIAKGVSLVPVRVLDCAGSGSLSSVIAGLDWVIANNGTNRAVVNLSLGGSASTSLDSAVAKTVASGITVVVAAGNSNVDACTASPAREPSAITVGATTNTDARATYSNYGSCLDVFAPGSAITSTWFSSTTATNTISGTSMASPHVTGVAALALETNTSATPAEIATLIKSQATSNKVTSAGYGSSNLLLYSQISSGGGSSTPSAPQVTVAIGGLTGSSSALRNGWKANVIVTVKDSSGNVQPGAVVKGAFTAGAASVSCTTASNGSCSMSTGTISKKVAVTSFAVSSIAGTNMTYSASLNTISTLTLAAP